MFSVLLLTQKRYDQQKDLFICFIKLEKASDRSKHNLLINALHDMSPDKKDTTLLQDLY